MNFVTFQDGTFVSNCDVSNTSLFCNVYCLYQTLYAQHIQSGQRSFSEVMPQLLNHEDFCKVCVWYSARETRNIMI